LRLGAKRTKNTSARRPRELTLTRREPRWGLPGSRGPVAGVVYYGYWIVDMALKNRRRNLSLSKLLSNHGQLAGSPIFRPMISTVAETPQNGLFYYKGNRCLYDHSARGSSIRRASDYTSISIISPPARDRRTVEPGNMIRQTVIWRSSWYWSGVDLEVLNLGQDSPSAP